MKNTSGLFKIYLSIITLLTLCALTFKTIAVINSEFYDYRHAYFIKATLPNIANVLVCIVIVSFLIYIIGIQKAVKLIPSFSSPLNYVPSAALAAAIFFMFLRFGAIFLNSLAVSEYEQKSFADVEWLAFLLTVFAALSVIYLILNTVFIRTVSARRANFGFCIIIFFALYLTYLYFDVSVPINSPIKITDQFTYTFTSVFFLYEIRLSLGREKWKSYLIFGFISAILAAYSAIPALIFYFVKGVSLSDTIRETVLTLTILIFISSKLALTYRLTKSGEHSLITNLKRSAEERISELSPAKIEEEPEVTETEEEIEVPDEKQIAILQIQENGEETEIRIEDLTDGIPTMNISSEEYH